jgi:hypothetical protein
MKDEIPNKLATNSYNNQIPIQVEERERLAFSFFVDVLRFWRFYNRCDLEI